jgi:hypothetical protein
VLKTGDEVVVKGEGMWRKGRQGDLILKIEVETPTEEWAYQLAEKGGIDTLRGLLPPRRQDVGASAVAEGKETDEVVLEEKKERVEDEEQWVRFRPLVAPAISRKLTFSTDSTTAMRTRKITLSPVASSNNHPSFPLFALIFIFRTSIAYRTSLASLSVPLSTPLCTSQLAFFFLFSSVAMKNGLSTSVLALSARPDSHESLLAHKGKPGKRLT